MPDVLRVAALQLGDPFTFLVLPEAYDPPLDHVGRWSHAEWVRTASLPRVSFE